MLGKQSSSNLSESALLLNTKPMRSREKPQGDEPAKALRTWKTSTNQWRSQAVKYKNSYLRDAEDVRIEFFVKQDSAWVNRKECI